MPIDFPSSPTTGQVYTYLGKSWVYNGTAWDAPKALSEIGAVQTFANAAARTAAIPTPTEGIVTYLVDTNALELFNNGWNVINPSSGNVIINGAFDIWQRGTSFTTGSAGQLVFSADRWILYNYGTNTGSCTQQTFSPGTAPVAGYEGSFFARFNSTSTLNFFQHRVEDVRTFAGQTATLSFFAKSASAQTLTVNVVQQFGSGGSSQVVITNTVALTTSWARHTITVSLASIAGKTIGTSSALTLEFAGAANNAIDIWGVQLEAGAVATPFRRNANSLQGELAACQRYYIRYTTPGGSSRIATGISTSTTNAACFFPLPVTMRISPSSIDFSTLAITNEVTYTNVVTALTLFTNAPQGIAVNATATGQTTNQAVHMVLQTNGFIGFSAEL
jgi:hypothetical protein